VRPGARRRRQPRRSGRPDARAHRRGLAARSGRDRRGRDLYIKRRPVPFGEYVPGRRWLGWIPALDQVPRDAIAGPGPQAFEIAPGVTSPSSSASRRCSPTWSAPTSWQVRTRDSSWRSRTMRPSSVPPNRTSTSRRVGCERSRPAAGSSMPPSPARPRSSTRRWRPRRDPLFEQAAIRRTSRSQRRGPRSCRRRPRRPVRRCRAARAAAPGRWCASHPRARVGSLRITVGAADDPAPVVQRPRIPPFQGGDAGSNPVGGTQSEPRHPVPDGRDVHDMR
jgi:hypothetical protein